MELVWLEHPCLRTTNLVDVSRITVSKVMIAYTNLGRVSSLKHRSERKLKLKDSDRRLLKTIVVRKRNNILRQIPAR
ncbi:hypothetical protein TNCV_1333011 [Trichonephila clavipes]|nr:hypothetical protein TNCV_1333011 [Trichonephila clavipes]